MMIAESEIGTGVLHGRFAAVPSEFLARVRIKGRDDLGQPVRRVRAKGGEPCRDAFRRAAAGEELILASFSPFGVAGPYHEYGPIFVFANDQAAGTPVELPIGGPDDYLGEQFVIRAYSKDEDILDARLVQASQAQRTAEAFFARADVEFLHVRFPTFGCFACRLDRI